MKTMFNKYILLVVLIAIMVILYGFVCPFLVSATSTEAVILGIFLAIISIPLIAVLIKNLLKGGKSEKI